VLHVLLLPELAGLGMCLCVLVICFGFCGPGVFGVIVYTRLYLFTQVQRVWSVCLLWEVVCLLFLSVERGRAGGLFLLFLSVERGPARGLCLLFLSVERGPAGVV
jgi:hypothetical protein